MCFYSRVILDMDSLFYSLDTVVSIYEPQVGPFVAVAFDVAATKNGSYKFLGALAFLKGLAIIQYLIPFLS